MSGIAGIIHFDGAPVEPGLVERMTASMAYRGPDDIHHWVKGSVALGQCMLRTTPESLEETQPLTNEDESLVLVMDGRVDNWEELRKELLGRGARLRTRADAELVLRAYEAWGRECLAHIDGDFALVIWDGRRQEAFCARDRMGNRPFYYWQDKKNFAFASDFHSILCLPRSPREVNENMIAEHLLVRVRNLTDTLISGINRLPPAHFLVMGNASSSQYKYWDVDCFARIRYRHESEYAEHFLDLFRQIVRQKTRSLSPIGVYLSGGIDSSSVACVASGLTSQNEVISSFSLVFPGQTCDESHFIEMVNRKCALNGQTLPCDPAPLSHYLKQTRQFLDLCDGPNGAMLDPLRSLAQMQGIRVLLTGYGGDEWYGQSGPYYAHLLKNMKLITMFRQLAFDYKDNRSASRLLNSLLFRGLSPLLPDVVRNPLRQLKRWATHQLSSTGKHPYAIVHPGLAHRLSLDERRILPNRCLPGADPAHRYRHSLLPLGWNVRGMEIENRGLALFGLEERSPFNDRKLIEYGFALPEYQRSKDAGKYVIRQSMCSILPEPIRQRHDKAEFSSVLADTLIQDEAHEWALGGNMAARGWIDASEVERMYKEFAALYRDRSDGYIKYVWPLWMVLALEVWVAVIKNQ